MYLIRKNIFILILFFALVLLFFHKFLGSQEIFAFKDLSRYFYPLRYLMIEQVKDGHFPLWNPYIYYGLPLLATLQIGFFYLPTVIYYILPFDLAFNYYIILHYFLAACFMYLLSRHLKLSWPAGIISSVIFTFSGYLMSVSNMNTSLTSVVWLPLVFLWFDKFIKERKLKNILILSIFWVFMYLGGEPTIIYMSTLLMIAWAVFTSKRIYGFLKNIIYLGVSQIIFILIAAVQFIPFAEFAFYSHRVGKISFEMITFESLPIRELINFVLPFFFGNPLRAASYSALFLQEIHQNWILSPYLGIIPIILWGLGLFKREKRTFFFLSGVVVFSILLSFGKFTPLYFILYKVLPGFSLIRYPVKHLFLAAFAISLLGGIGLDAFFDEKNRIAKRFLGVLVGFWGVIVSATFMTWLFRGKIFNYILSLYPKLPPYLVQSLKRNLEFNLYSFIYLTMILLLLIVIFYLMWKQKIKPAIFSTIIIALLIMDYFGANSSLQLPTKTSVIKDRTPNIEIMLKEKGLFRYHYSGKIYVRTRTLYGESYAQGLEENKDQLAANRLLVHNLYDTLGYTSMRLRDWLIFNAYIGNQPLKVQHKIWNMVNVKYFADAEPVHLKGLKFIRKAEYFYGKLYFYRNQNVLPRAFYVSKSKIIKERPKILEYMAGTRFSPKYEVVLEEGQPAYGKNIFRKVEILDYGPSSIRLFVNAPRPGYVFLSDTYYPGWKVYVDGKGSKILRANYMFRAVKVDEGGHEIRYIYDPLSFKLGAIVSGLSLLLFGFVFVKYGNKEI